MAKKENFDNANSGKQKPKMPKPYEGKGKMDGGTPDAGMGGQPGVRKNKDMNKYKNGGAVLPAMKSQKMSGKARGGNKSTKGLDFKVT